MPRRKKTCGERCSLSFDFCLSVICPTLVDLLRPCCFSPVHGLIGATLEGGVGAPPRLTVSLSAAPSAQTTISTMRWRSSSASAQRRKRCQISRAIFRHSSGIRCWPAESMKLPMMLAKSLEKSSGPYRLDRWRISRYSDRSMCMMSFRIDWASVTSHPLR